jgi:cell division protein FtsL
LVSFHFCRLRERETSSKRVVKKRVERTSEREKVFFVFFHII